MGTKHADFVFNSITLPRKQFRPTEVLAKFERNLDRLDDGKGISWVVIVVWNQS